MLNILNILYLGIYCHTYCPKLTNKQFIIYSSSYKKRLRQVEYLSEPLENKTSVYFNY
jgi:hypothetical protein